MEKCPICGAWLELMPCHGSFEWLCPRREDGRHYVIVVTDHTTYVPPVASPPPNP